MTIVVYALWTFLFDFLLTFFDIHQIVYFLLLDFLRSINRSKNALHSSLMETLANSKSCDKGAEQYRRNTYLSDNPRSTVQG